MKEEMLSCTMRRSTLSMNRLEEKQDRPGKKYKTRRHNFNPNENKIFVPETFSKKHYMFFLTFKIS